MSYWDEAMREAYEEMVPSLSVMTHPKGGVIKSPCVGIIGDHGPELMLPLEDGSVMVRVGNTFATKEIQKGLKWGIDYIDRRKEG